MKRFCFVVLVCFFPKILPAQLLTSREIVLRAMKENPGNLWPRGEGHVVLAIPGSLEEEKAYLEPGGSFSPAFGSFGVSVWISDKYNYKTWSCDMLFLNEIKQCFIKGQEPSVFTVTSDYEMTHTIHSTYDASIRIKNISPAGHRLSLMVRSVGPAGGPVRTLQWNGQELTVNEEWTIRITPPPSYVTLGDETTEGWKTQTTSATYFESLQGWGFARMGLGDREHVIRITRNKRPYRPSLRYASLFSSLKIQLPDKRFAESLDAQVAHLMMGLVRDECRPGEPNNYPLPWLRDGAFVLVALARAGQLETARTLAYYFARHDFFGGFGPEADAPGLAIWAIMQVAYELKDSSFYREIWPHVKRKTELIERMLQTSTPVHVPITFPVLSFTRNHPDSTLVCEPARDGLIIGRMDWHRPLLFVNATAYSGLKHAAALARMLGKETEASAWQQKAVELQKAWCAAFDREADNERTYICSFWPDYIALPIKEKYLVKATANRLRLFDSAGLYKEKPLWTYFSFSEAHQWLYLRQPEQVWPVLEYFWAHQCSPGLYTWWEGNGEENTSGRWDHVCGWVKPQHVTPHYWTAAEALCLQLDMLAWYDESQQTPALVIGEGMKKEWLASPLKVEGIHVHGNEVSWQWDGKKLEVWIKGEKIPVRAGTPFGPKTRIKVTKLP